MLKAKRLSPGFDLVSEGVEIQIGVSHGESYNQILFILGGLTIVHTIGTWWMWTGFFAFVLLVLIIDILFLGGKKTNIVTTRTALSWTLIWISCALVFNGVLWLYLKSTVGAVIAHELALQFFTGYLIEKSLSIDNMFVFLLIFNYFAVPKANQRRVLIYGVLCAFVLRLVTILAGTWLVSQLHWILYLFGLFLLITGIKMLVFAQDKNDLNDNIALRWLRNHLRITETFHGEKFFIKQNSLIYCTPLFLVLILIEISDVVFALDSLPAIFAISSDPFIIFTSNVFAILGLRALYFLLVNMETKFHLLKYGIALMLSFIGLKMLIEPWANISIPIALSVVVAILATTVILSLLIPAKKR